MSLYTFMGLSRKQRRAHLDLTTPCEFDGKSNTTRQRRGLRRLLDHLSLTDDWVGPKQKSCVMCHVCDHGSNKEWCNNPRHIYFGRKWEDHALDKTPAARRRAGGPNLKSKGGHKTTNAQVWVSLIDGYKSTAAGVARYHLGRRLPNWRIRVD